VLGTVDIPEIAITSPTAPGVTHRWTNMTAFTDEVANARIWAGFHYRFSTRVEAAVPLLQRALKLTRSRGQGEIATRAKARLGYALALSGYLDQGVTMLEDLRSPTGVKRRSLWPLGNIWLAEAYALAGRVDDAEAEARRALILARRRQARGDEAWALLVLSEIVARREPSDGEEFGDHCLAALALANELGMRPLVAHCHLGLGKLYRRTDKREQAREHLATATTMYREMGMTYWLEKAEAEVTNLRR
jgi:tetratricopeptide (TPR) repeat protein